MFDIEIERPIPAGLDEIRPGPVLAALLSTIDVTEVSGHDRVVVLRAHQRMAAHYAAETYRDMVAVASSLDELDPGDGSAAWKPEAASAEIRAALTLTRRAADDELAFAIGLKRRLPKVWNALAAGAIDVRKARVFVSGTIHVTEDIARRVAELVLVEAGDLTTGQLAARLRRLCIDADTGEARKRFERAVECRRVEMWPDPQGTADIWARDLPPQRAEAAMHRINRIARSLRSGGETRTMDQLRADVFLDLLEGVGHAVGTDRGVVDVRVDLETLAGLSEEPGDLSGYGPVIADIARQVARDQVRSEWRYVVTDTNGAIVHNGITRRRPTSDQRRTVEARYQTCVFPGCRMPAAGCDLDHGTPFSEGGPTTVGNLAPCCRHDHNVVRHRVGWTYERLVDGRHRWTSRLGRAYITRAPPA